MTESVNPEGDSRGTTGSSAQMGVMVPVRLWPAWVIAAAMVVVLVVTVTSSIANRPRFFVMMGGPLVGALMFSLWVLFASRLFWSEKLLLALAGLIWPLVAGAVSVPESALRTAMWVHGIPLAIFAVTAGLSYCSYQPFRTRVAIVLLGLGWLSFGLVRNEGFDGEYYPEFVWRWSARHEDTLSDLSATKANTAAAPVKTGEVVVAAAWPQFRGPAGDGSAAGEFRIADWKTTPPKERWRIAVGPGWSSFVYDQGQLFTQEQRNEKEFLTCYSAADGSIIWSHADENRFDEVVSGAGPRSTPSVAGGRVFAMGGRGLLTCVQESDGTVVWQRNVVKEFGATVPMWGFSGSPLVVDGLVVIFAGGNDNNGWMAFSAQTGEKVWGIASEQMNYTTARVMTLIHKRCLVFCDSRGVHGVDVASGSTLWTHKPADWNGTPMVDVQQLGPSSLLVALGDGIGVSRVDLQGLTQPIDNIDVSTQWSFQDAWTSRQLRPAFNDSLIVGDAIYGFNQAVFSCIDAKTGKRLWQGGRYGFGQAVLLKDAGCIVVAAENGDAVLLKANAQRLEELGRISVLEDKTWNHPIAVGNCVFLRNGKVAVCLEL